MSNIEEIFYCSACRHHKTVAEFGTTANGTRKKTCLACNCCISEANKKQRAGNDPDKENHADPEEEDPDLGTGLGILSFDDFLDALTQQDDNLELEACVDISTLSGSRWERADDLAKLIWNRMKYQFVCMQTCY
ncbi:hypothetical protein B0H10DRAFT_2224730 [Mycena sp. CBHHK59/15]|nr:hypothetical protein B0H10DRAFT_2224730 [Mycena sp. CBHHK59/15]